MTEPTDAHDIELQVGDTVRHEFDDGSMGTATIIAIAMDQAWCFYANAECHRVQPLRRLTKEEAP
jgi:hypothetical protein